MDIAKKQKLIILIEFVFILFFLFLIGSGNVISPVYGDINVIDEGQFGAWIMHMFAGGHLYKDTYAAYGPLYIYPVYLLAKIFSPTVFLIRVVYNVINILLAISITQVILRELKIPYYLQLLCIALLLVIPGFGMRQGIGLLAIYFIYQAVKKKNLLWSIFGGISLATAFLTSSDIGLFSFFICAAYIIYYAVITKDIRYFSKKIILIIASYLIIFLIFYFWSNSEGWFYAYVSTIYSDFVIYSTIAIPIGKNFPNAILLMPQSFSVLKWMKYIFSQELLLYWLYLFYIVTIIYFFIRIILKKYTKAENLILLISFFGLLLSTILIGRTDHLNFTLPPVFILFAYYLTKLSTKYQLQSGTKKLFSLFFILIIAVFSIRLMLIYRPHFADILSIPQAVAHNNESLQYVGPIAISQTQAKSIKTIQSFIASHTTNKDTVFFFSNDPMLYLLVNRVSPTKYDLPEVANIKDKRIELLHDISTAKPKYIVYDISSYSVDGVSNYTRLPEVAAYLKKNFTKSKLGTYIIYSWKK